MKSTMTEEIENTKYPCLMVGKDGVVILFAGEDKGIVVFVPDHNPNRNFIGEYSASWVMQAFKPFYGKILLKS